MAVAGNKEPQIPQNVIDEQNNRAAEEQAAADANRAQNERAATAKQRKKAVDEHGQIKNPRWWSKTPDGEHDIYVTEDGSAWLYQPQEGVPGPFVPYKGEMPEYNNTYDLRPGEEWDENGNRSNPSLQQQQQQNKAWSDARAQAIQSPEGRKAVAEHDATRDAALESIPKFKPAHIPAPGQDVSQQTMRTRPGTKLSTTPQRGINGITMPSLVDI